MVQTIRASVIFILSLLFFCAQAYAQTPDGIEDTSDFPVDYWAASYYEGRDGTPGSSAWGNPATGTGAAGSKVFRGEAYFGIGSNDVTIASNGSAASNRWSNSETPTSPNLHTPGYVGATWTGANPHYQIDLRRTVVNPGTLTFGGGATEVVDDIVDVYVNGVRVYAYFPSGGAPDPRPGQGVLATINLNAGDEVLFRFINLGYIGGFTYRFQSPPIVVELIANNDSVSLNTSPAAQNNVLSLGNNDTFGGGALPSTDVYSVASGSSLPPELTLDTDTGSVGIVPNTPAGTYSFQYQVCETASETNCDVATATVTLTSSISNLSQFTCPSRFYEAIDGQLTRYDPVTETYINVGSDQLFYNGTGYNILDNYGYALGKEGVIENDLIRIGSNGDIEVVASNIAQTSSGDMGVDGYLYYSPQATRIRRVLVTSPFTKQTLNFTGPANQSVLDVAYLTDGLKEYFAGARDGRVYIWNITDLVTFSYPVTGLESGGFGAAWTANDGHLYVNSNTSGKIYNIANPLTAPTILADYNAVTSSKHDGLSCPLADSPFNLATELSGSKSVTMANSGEYAIPGNDIVYTITVENTGAGSVDTDTVFLVDQLPPEITFFVGDMDGTGPGTDPITFTETASGLTFNYATDAGFSNNATPPSNFSQCNYSPTTGYDENIKHVCFAPKGAFSAGTPNPNFSVSFRARIK